MIKSISNIVDISVIDQSVNNNLYSFSKIEFNDIEIGSGGFGSVHMVQAIDGEQTKSYVLKVVYDENKTHAFETISLLHEKLKLHQSKTGLPIFHEYPELLGIPFLAFKGYDAISEKHCTALLMFNLFELGYEDYGSDKQKSLSAQSLNIEDKLYLAYQFARTIHFLHDLEYIHSDINEQSLFFNYNTLQFVLIDFDSGYHFDKQKRPSTLGKISHWIGSGLQKIIGQQESSKELTTEKRLYNEYFVLASGIFEIIFGIMPYFFLSDAGGDIKRKYLKKYEWPNIDSQSDLFNQSNLENYNRFIEHLGHLEEGGLSDLIDNFKIAFNKGYLNENKSISPKDWKELLFEYNADLQNYPIIKSFDSDKNAINFKGEKVKFTFDVIQYNRIYINNKLVSLNSNSFDLELDEESTVTLKAVNDFNELNVSLVIKANKLQPQILGLKSSKKIRNNLEPITLSWETKNAVYVKLSISEDQLPSFGQYQVSPTDETTYVLTAFGNFDETIKQSITIDITRVKIKRFDFEINIEKGIDNVDVFWETENAQKLEIEPRIGVVKPTGLEHIKIKKETEFKLIAEGYFDKAEKVIKAHPFPVPIVKNIFVKTPKIELSTRFDSKPSQFPIYDFDISKINFQNTINVSDMKLDYDLINNSLIPPEFENENELLNKTFNESVSFKAIYEKIKQKIYKKL
jgi:serine/threonine protein kinase